MISVNRTDILNGTMVVAGCAAAAIVLKNVTLVTAGLCAKVGANAAHRRGYQNEADVLKNNGERLIKMATKHMKRDFIFASAFAAVGLAAYAGQNYLTMQHIVWLRNIRLMETNTTNTTGFIKCTANASGIFCS